MKMKAKHRWVLSVVALLLATVLVQHAIAAGGAPGKEIVGHWEGTFLMGKSDIPVKLELRADGNKIVGELQTPHGPWTVTDAKYEDGKWNVEIHGPENAGMMQGVLNGDKFEGNYQFPPNAGGDFKLSRVKKAK